MASLALLHTNLMCYVIFDCKSYGARKHREHESLRVAYLPPIAITVHRPGPSLTKQPLIEVWVLVYHCANC